MPRILGEVHGINFSGIQKPIGIYIALFGSEIIVDIISQHVAHVQSVGDFTVTNAQALYPEITYILPYSAYTIYAGTPFFISHAPAILCSILHPPQPTPQGGRGDTINTLLIQPRPTPTHKTRGLGDSETMLQGEGGPRTWI